jgi:hypothetical protein
MNVIAMILKVFSIANSVVSETSLPNLRLAPSLNSGGMRIPSFNKLHRAFQGDVDGGRKQ